MSAIRVYRLVKGGSAAMPSAISCALARSRSDGNISLTTPQDFAVAASRTWRVKMK